MAKLIKISIVKFDGEVGTVNSMAARLGLSLTAMRRRIYYRHKSLSEITVGFIESVVLGRKRSARKPKSLKEAKHCIECGSVISTKRRRFFCSDECAASRKRRDKPKHKCKPSTEASCVICGNTFARIGNSPHKTCSSDCRDELRRRYTKEANRLRMLKMAEATKARRLERIAAAEARKAARLAEREAHRLSNPVNSCTVCGGPVYAPRKAICGKECSRKKERAREKDRKKRNKKPFDPSIYLTSEDGQCPHCKKELPKPRHIGRIYCSAKCSKRFGQAKAKKGDKQRVRYAISGRIRELLKKKGLQKKNSCQLYLGMSSTDFYSYIESMFTDGMTWENYGVFGWHVDHAIPCAAFDMSREDHLMLCFNWRNLRPLWHGCNIKKADTVDDCDRSFVGAEFLEEARKLGVRC
jgi:predicted nucleic acid-binding Zn ribbon protein